MYVKRDIEKDLINLLNSSVSRIILISGARQTGKTTMLQNFKFDKEKLIINMWDENTEVQSLKMQILLKSSQIILFSSLILSPMGKNSDN